MGLTILNSGDGFTAGDFDVKGYFGAVGAFQKVYIADGRPYSDDINDSGYHIIDMISTKITGVLTGGLLKGDTIVQVTGGAAGIFIESIDATTHLIYRTTTTEFDPTVGNLIKKDASNYIAPTAKKAPPHWLNWILKGSFASDFSYEGTADSGGDTTLVDASLVTQYTIDNYLNNWYVYITGGTGKGSYAMVTSYAASTGTITVADWLTPLGEAGGVNPSVDSTYGLSESAPSSGGEFPDGGSNTLELFEGRIWMNSMFNPNQWFATRQGDPLDLDSSLDDVQAAITSQSSEAGLVADALINFIRYKDNYLLFGCANSMWILRGGSTGSGSISNLTYETGIFSPDSYCWDNNGNLYVIGLTGFFKFPNNMAVSGVAIDNISLRKLPNLFRVLQLNRKTDRVVMGFDKDTNRIEVSISTQDGSWNVCFCYDITTDSIIPDTFLSGKAPSSFLYMNSYQDEISGLLVGCNDGYIRKEDVNTKTDDGDVIESYTLFGPITINSFLRANVKIKEILITLSEASDGVEWKLYQAKSNELIVKGLKAGTLTPTHSGVFTKGGREVTIYEKIAGESLAIMLRNSTLNTSWSLENIKIKWNLVGRVKD